MCSCHSRAKTSANVGVRGNAAMNKPVTLVQQGPGIENIETKSIYIYMGVLPGGGGGQTGPDVANRGNFSPFLDFCPNVVTLARKKLFYFGRAESKKTGVRAWGDGGEALSRPEVGRFCCFLPVFCRVPAADMENPPTHEIPLFCASCVVFWHFGCVPPLFWTCRTQKKHVLGLNDTMGRHNRAICSTEVLQQSMCMKMYQGPASLLFSLDVITCLGIPNVSPPILDVENPKKQVFELDETMGRQCMEATRGWLPEIS